jgi:hypothetical protein
MTSLNIDQIHIDTNATNDPVQVALNTCIRVIDGLKDDLERAKLAKYLYDKYSYEYIQPRNGVNNAALKS